MSCGAILMSSFTSSRGTFIQTLICYLSSMQSVPTSLNYLPCKIESRSRTGWFINSNSIEVTNCDEHLNSSSHSWRLHTALHWYLHIHWDPSFLLLFHMHTLISHQYSPPGLPYASAPIPWGERLHRHCDFQLTNFTRHGKMSPWITLELLHAFKSIQKTIKSNGTAPPIAVPSLCLMTPAQEDGKGGL